MITKNHLKPASVPVRHDLYDTMREDRLAVAGGQKRAPLAGVVAVVGCDGSGKTRLVADLVASLCETRPVQRRYMGLVSGETGDRIKELPLIGVTLERYLAAKVRRAQDMKKKLPGPITAMVMYLFSLWRVWQLRRLKKRAESGVLIIAERYPQAEIPGFHYDGPGLAVDRTSGWLASRLARREQALYERMAEQKPALVIRLNVDPETAYMRKPDHPLSELREKSEIMPRIRYNGAKILELDSRFPYSQVLEKALMGIEREML